MQICKYCNTQMMGEYETLSNSRHFRFFYSCPNCKAIYEGERKEKGAEIVISKSRWYNPKSEEFEE